jgi:hypothetical protein
MKSASLQLKESSSPFATEASAEQMRIINVPIHLAHYSPWTGNSSSLGCN